MRALVERHFEHTRSPRAGWILENWASMVLRFVKVFPHEFKRVLGIPRLSEAPKFIPVARPELGQVVHG